MNILVTGASGFTGSNLARRLLDRGDAVRTILRPGSTLPDLVSDDTGILEGDLRDADTCREAVRGCQAVYHIAALYRSEESRQAFFDVNVGGTRNLLEACKAEGVDRIVHCSTVGVHGHVEHPPADEQAPFNPGDPYQESKLEGEKLAMEYARRDAMPISIFRPTGIYGPGDMRLLKFVRMVNKRRPLIGSGRPHYHLTFIDDLVDGIILCGEHPEATGQVFILGGPEAPTLREWYDTIAEVLQVKPVRWQLPVWPFLAAGAVAEALFKPLGKQPPLHRRSVHFFTHDRAFSIEKARTTIGFEPRVGVHQGMMRTTAWYKEHNLL